MAAHVPRALSGLFCSTSRQPESLFIRCGASRADASRHEPWLPVQGPGVGSWVGTGCNLQRRPQLPQISSKVREGAAIVQGLQPSPNGNGVSRDGDSFVSTQFVAESLIPTHCGKYRVRAYRHSYDGGRTCTEPTCIMTGRPEGGEGIPVRVHDACFTSEVLGSLKCDCADQFRLAQRYIQEHPPGILIYLQQEGRGIGLANKIAAYALQEEGLDTVDANRALGLPDDCREYTSVRNILADLGVRSIRLMTNNPRKIAVLEELGVVVVERLPCLVQAQEHSLGYLTTKQNRMSHLMGAVAAPEEPEGELDGSFCFWDHDGEPLKPSPLRGPGTPPRSRRAQPAGQPRLRLGFDQGSGADDALAAESITPPRSRPSALEQPGLGSV